VALITLAPNLKADDTGDLARNTLPPCAAASYAIRIWSESSKMYLQTISMMLWANGRGELKETQSIVTPGLCAELCPIEERPQHGRKLGLHAGLASDESKYFIDAGDRQQTG
jgi:hypothetical protein